MPPTSTSPEEPDGGAPELLLAFLGAMLIMVGAVVVIARTSSDWADVGAFALLVGLVAAMGVMLGRRLRDGGPPP